MKKLYLVDVSSMFFRAFYAIPPLRTSAGLPTNALYGFLSMSIKLLRESRPDYLVYCFDRKEPSFRVELYEEYKANRTEMPEDLQAQMPYIRQISELLGVACLDSDGFEADDVIGTLAVAAAKKNIEVSIVSGDKDFAQLVNGNISIYDTMKNIRYDRAGVLEKFGVTPEQIIDYLAIVGDTSDNIPGVRGIGPKGAQKLLSEFKTLEGVYEHLKDIKSENIRGKLTESKKEAFLAKQLVTIVTNVPVGTDFEKYRLSGLDSENLKALMEKLEFGAFSRKLFGDATNSGEAAKSSSGAEVTVADDKMSQKKSTTKKATRPTPDKSKLVEVKAGSQQSEKWNLEKLQKQVRPYEEIWATLTERGFCLSYDDKLIQVDATLQEIGGVLGKKLLAWKGFDLKSIWRALEMEEVNTPAWDTMLAAYIIKAGSAEEFTEIYKNWSGHTVPDLAGPEEFLACEKQLEPILRHQLEEYHGLNVLNELELPLVPALYLMEKRGICVDKEVLNQQGRLLEKDVAVLEKKIHEMAGEKFNIASPKQLSHILFEKLKVPVMRKTKTGYSTDSDVLSKLASKFPICDSIINYRELTKLKSTYVDALPSLIDDHGRVHTHYHQAATQTGRLSSTNPNLQNIPIRTERGREIRKAFIAEKGSVLLSVDYSQIELRVIAEITGDPGLVEAFSKGLDIHSATASEIFNVKLADVTDEQRRMAKAVNFGIAYGQGVFGLSETLEISRDEAKTIIENYFKKFAKVKDFMLDTISVAKEQGYVESLFGRRRYIDEFKSTNGAVKKFGERAAINAPIQGTSSDLMKKAMIEVHENVSIPMLLQVHDELLFECPRDRVEEEAKSIKKIMESVGQFKVPLIANVAWGENWEDAHA